MTAGRSAGDRNKVRVAAVFPNMFPDPGDGFFNIDNVGRKCCLGAQTIVDCNAQPAPLCHVVHQWLRLLFLLPDDPCAAVHL